MIYQLVLLTSVGIFCLEWRHHSSGLTFLHSKRWIPKLRSGAKHYTKGVPTAEKKKSQFQRKAKCLQRHICKLWFNSRWRRLCAILVTGVSSRCLYGLIFTQIYGTKFHVLLFALQLVLIQTHVAHESHLQRIKNLKKKKNHVNNHEVHSPYSIHSFIKCAEQ